MLHQNMKAKKSNLKTHVVSVHEVRIPFKCGVCERFFAKKSRLNRHMKSVHDN